MATPTVLDTKSVFEFEGVLFPTAMTSPDKLHRLKDFEVREDDLILATYLKCGTHLMMEVIHLMKVDGHVDKIKRSVEQQSPFECGVPPKFEIPYYDLVADLSSPRFYFTHLPFRLLPPQVVTKKPKIVYVTRNPKDALASLYRFMNANPLNKEPFIWDHMFEGFISGKALSGNWFDTTLEYWNRRDDENIFFVTFEEIEKDLRSVVLNLEKFLGLTVTPDGMERILEHASLEGMKKTYAKLEKELVDGRMYTRAFGLSAFIQKGVSGGWKEFFTGDQSDRMDQLMRERLSGTGLEEHYH